MMKMAGMRGVHILLLLAMVGRASGQCYLLDADALCEVCWKTTYASVSDNVGVTTVAECPEGLVEQWDVPPPEKMIALIPYTVTWSVNFNLTAFPVIEGHIPHANLHSCIASRGVCSPFVANSPGLSTHTKALKSDTTVNGNSGSVTFTTDLSLTKEQYTIIAHVRFFVPPSDPSLPNIKYDMAIGASRNVLPQETLCEPGSVYDSATDTCNVCPPGTHQEDLNCTKCSMGTHAPVEGLSACIPCEAGYTDLEGQTSCVSCPELTQRRPASPGKSVQECLCLPGSYAKYGVGRECLECPVGAVCPGGRGRPYPKRGFWGDVTCDFDPELGNSSCPGFDHFIECNPVSDCAGGPEFSCEAGHSGRMCKEAQSGWFIVGGAFWLECGETGHFVGTIGIICVVLVWLAINKVASGHYDAMDLALLFVQITGMISTFGLKWHENLSVVNTAFGIANFDVDFVTPLCLTKWTGVESFYVQLSMPAIYAAGCIIYYSTVHFFGRYVVHNKSESMHGWNKLQDNLVNKVASFIIVMYHTLCIKCFQSFHCEEFPDGRSFMKFAPDVECWKPDHISMVVVSALYIPTVLVGFPVYIAYIIKRAEDNGTLHNPAFMSKWDFAYSRYDPGFKWWEAMLTLRRFSIALISISLDTSLLQASLTIIVLVFLLIWHAHTRPFLSDQIDTLEVFTICGSIFYALAGMLFYPSITLEAQGHICTDGKLSACSKDVTIKYVISILMIVWMAATLIYSTWVSFANVVQVNNADKANKVMKSMIGLVHGSFNSSQTWTHGGTGDVATRFKAAFKKIKAVKAIQKRIGSSSRSEQEQDPSGFGGDSASFATTLEPPTPTMAPMVDSEPTTPFAKEETGGEEAYERDFLAAFERSSNRMTLDDLVDGKGMLRWAREVEKMPTNKKKRCMEDFEVVTLGLLGMKRDVTHFSCTQYAKICRQMGSLEGVMDYLTACSDEERTALSQFMEGYSAFMEEREKFSDSKKNLYPFQSTCVPEHTGVVLSYIVNSHEGDVKRVANVLKDISGLEEGEKIQSRGPSRAASKANLRKRKGSWMEGMKHILHPNSQNTVTPLEPPPVLNITSFDFK